MKVLPRKFYINDTKQVARDLLGKKLVRKIGGQVLSGIIIETEAYKGKMTQLVMQPEKKLNEIKLCLGKLDTYMFISHMECTIVSMWLQKKKMMNLVLF